MFSLFSQQETPQDQTISAPGLTQELSPKRRHSIERWLDHVPVDPEAETPALERPLQPPLPRRHRDSAATARTIDTIFPGSSTSNDDIQNRTPPQSENFRRWPELLKIPPGADHREIARAPSRVWAMDKVDLLKSHDNQITEVKDGILVDYVRHLVSHALETNQNPDIIVGRASLEIESDFRSAPIRVLRNMLMTMVQGMNEQDRETVHIALHTRGICEPWRCPECRRGRGQSRPQ